MIHLSLDEVIEDKPFTLASHTATDAQNLERLRHALARSVHSMTNDDRGCQQHLDFVEEDGRAMRHIIVRPWDLLDAHELTAVGFCGHKRAPLNLHEQEEMAAVDAELVAELCQHPNMLSYCSIETSDGNWHNLVLMNHAEAMPHWRNSARHGWAVDSLAPRFYRHIRLHNGVLPNGLSSDAIILTSTKYYDFDGAAPWRAMRSFG